MEALPRPGAMSSIARSSTSGPLPELHSVGYSTSSSAANTTAPEQLHNVQDGVSSTPSSTKPSILKRAWANLGINGFVVMFMIKGALAPTICLSIYQRHSVAVNYLNLGYVMIVVSILNVPILPRGKYLMNMFITLVSSGLYRNAVSLFARCSKKGAVADTTLQLKRTNNFFNQILTCFAAANVLLGQFLSIKARESTTPAGAPPAVANGYNSSASAVNAMFMIVNVFAINVLRAARPSFSIPSVEYTIFIVVGFVYGPQEPTEYHSVRFVKELLYSFLTGQAIATGVSLFIIPVSSRKVFFGETAGFLQSCRGLLKAQLAFVEVLEHSELCEPSVPMAGSMSEEDTANRESTSNEFDANENRQFYKQRASALKAASAGVLGLAGKLRDDVVFAKREMAFGCLRSNDIHQLHLLLRSIMLPISGLSTISDISERLKIRYGSERRKFEKSQCPAAHPIEYPEKDQRNEQGEWRQMIRELRSAFEPTIQILDEAVLHALIVLKLVPDKNTGRAVVGGTSNLVDGAVLGVDAEKGTKFPEAGDIDFGDHLDRAIQDFRKQRKLRLQKWTLERELDVISQSSASANHVPWPSEDSRDDYKRLKMLRAARASQRLHLILYMEYLLYSVANATLALVKFADSKVKDGTLQKQRLIFPPAKVLIKWMKGLINGEDSGPDIDKFDNMASNVQIIYLGDSLKVPKDPEHLPPKNSWQVIGNRLRMIPRFLESDPVKFGARVTVATMSIGIMAYLQNTHAFFIRQRLVWSLVMIAIGMNPSSGSAVFTLLGNLTATIFAMICAFINWYIVDQRTAGIIVFFFLFQMLYFYFAAKNPRFLVPIVAGAITHVLIIGYELQVRVIGLKQATATGQPYYPIYELAPYRLLTVAGGVTVAYIWTIFPVPITEGSVLRRDLGRSLFLLANYLSCVTSTVEQRVNDKEGDMSLASSHGQILGKMRQKVLQKQLALLNSMRQNLAFMAWEPSLGGDFPKETFQTIINEVQSVINYLNVISYASEAFTAARIHPSSSKWVSEFARSRSLANLKSHEVTKLLSLLSASLLNKQPLPPYLKAPAHLHLYNQISENESRILGSDNINKPGFRAFAVMEVAHMCIVDSMTNILKHVRDLVGEVDFSYHVVNESARTSSTGQERTDGKQKDSEFDAWNQAEYFN